MPTFIPLTIRGRGAAQNPSNRFTHLTRIPDDDYNPNEDPAPETQFYIDPTRDILAQNASPDIPFDFSLNPYRGCEHGCIYCYARPTHEYLGFSAGLDFETKILVKEDAPELLLQLFHSRNWQPQNVSIGGVTDPYQPIERTLELTRRCLQVFAEFRNPVGVVTKNALVARDADILAESAHHHAAIVYLSITTLNPDLARKMEPRASAPAARLQAIERLRKAGVPVGVLVAPVIPGLTDHEAPAILKASADAGACTAGYVMLRLPYAVKELFADWLNRHFPERGDKVLGRVRDMRGGKLNETRFGKRMRGEGEWAEVFGRLFAITRARAGLANEGPRLSAAAFRVPSKQLTLF